MDPRAELEELRRLDELERKAASQDLGEIRKQKRQVLASQYYNSGGEKTLSDLIVPDRVKTNVADLPWYTRAAGGAKVALDQAAMGLKGLFTDLTPEDKAMLEQGRAFKDEAGTAGTVGNIGGEIALTAAPAVRGAQALQAGSRMLPQALRFLGGSLPTNVAASAATSAALAPENRGMAALGGAAGAGVGEVAGRVLTKTLGGAVANKVTPEARAMMDEGMYVPMWKATESKVLRDAAERAKVLPVAGNVIRQQERNAIEGFNRNMAAKATPPTPVLDDAGNVLRWETKPVKEIGPDALNTLRTRFDSAYDALYKGRGIPVDDAYGREVTAVLGEAKNYFPRIAGEIQAAAKQADDILRNGTESVVKRSGGQPVGSGPISSRLTSPVTESVELGHAATRPESVKQAIDALEKRITTAYGRGDAEAAELLKSLKHSIEDLRLRGLPPEVASEAAAINKAYATFMQLQRATGSLGAQTQGVTTPRQMLSAVKANDRSPGKSAFSRGNALNQADVLRAEQVLGSRLPDVGPGTAEKLAPLMMFGAPMMMGDLGATALLGTQTGQRFLQGALPGQAAVRNYGAEYLVPALRAYGMTLGN